MMQVKKKLYMPNLISRTLNYDRKEMFVASCIIETVIVAQLLNG